MYLLKSAFSASVFILLSGCCMLGPCDGVFDVSGSVTSSVANPCLLSVRYEGSSWVISERKVIGSFKESFVVQPSNDGHRIELTCGGELVLSKLIHYGKDVGIGEEVVLGEVAL